MYRLGDDAILFLPPETVEAAALEHCSRTKARQLFTMTDLDRAMSGIE